MVSVCAKRRRNCRRWLTNCWPVLVVHFFFLFCFLYIDSFLSITLNKASDSGYNVSSTNIYCYTVMLQLHFTSISSLLATLEWGLFLYVSQLVCLPDCLSTCFSLHFVAGVLCELFFFLYFLQFLIVITGCKSELVIFCFSLNIFPRVSLFHPCAC